MIKNFVKILELLGDRLEVCVSVNKIIQISILNSFVCADDLHHSQRFFSHFRTIFCLPRLNQC